MGFVSYANAQTQNYFTGVGGSSLAGSFWSTSAAPGGTYTSALNATNGAIINFGNANATVAGGSIIVAGINATANTTLSTFTGTISNYNNGVIAINVADGVTLDFGTQTFTASATAGYTYNGSSTGVLALAGGTYGGGFTLTSGTVILRGISALGSGVLNINGGTIAANAARAVTAITQINVGGNFTIGGTTGLAVTGSNISFTAPVALGDTTRTITLGGTGTYTFSGIISSTSTAGLIINSTAAGTLVLSGANTYSGGTLLNSANTIRIGTSDSALGTGALTFAASGSLATASGSTARNIGNAIAINGSFTATFDGGFANLTLSGAITGTGNFTQASSGFVILTNAANNYSGITNVSSAGTLQFANPGSLYNGVTSSWTPTNIIVPSGGTLAVNIGGASDFTTDNVFNTLLPNLIGGPSTNGLKSGSSFGFDTTNTSGTLVIPNILGNNSTGGTVGYTKLGTGTLSITGSNTYTGNTSIKGGILNLGSAQGTTSGPIGGGTGSLPTGTIVFGGGTLQFSSLNTTDYSSKIADTASAIAIDTNGQTITFGTAIGTGKTGGLTKSGTGILVLSTANTFTGNTLVSAGTLALSSNLSLQGSVIDTSGGGTIALTGGTTPTFAGLIGAGNLSRVLSPGYSSVTSITLNPATGVTNTYSGAISDGAIAMTLTKNGLGTQVLGGSNSYTGVTTVISGALNVTGNSSGAMGGWNIGNGTVAASVTFAAGSIINVASGNPINVSVSGGTTVNQTLSVSGTVVNNGTLTVYRESSGSNVTINTGGLWTQAGAFSVLIGNNTSTNSIFTISTGGVFNYTGSSTISLQPSNPTLTGSATISIGGTFLTGQSFNNIGTGTTSAAKLDFTTGGVLILTANIASLVTTTGTTTTTNPFLVTLTGIGTINTNGYTTAINSIISGSATGLIVTGGGTLMLSSANTYTGTTSANGGTLSLTGSLASTSILSFGGGTFNYAPTANAGSGNTQTVASTTIATGGSSSTIVTNGNILALGAITRTAFGGTLNFGAVAGGTVTTTTANTNGILGPWATYGSGAGLLYAANDGSGNIVAYTGGTTVATADLMTDALGTVSYVLQSFSGAVAASLSVNTIQYTGGAGTLTPGATLFSLNGLMNTSANLLTIGATTNTVTIGANKDLVITGPGNVTIPSIIANNGANVSTFTMAGTGTVTLSGANTYTGTTFVNSGTLVVSNRATAALANIYIVAQGATLDLGYGIGQATGSSGVTVNGNGINATTGLYLAGGKSFNFQSPLTLQTAPTTIRAYGTGVPSLLGYDINGIHLNVAAAASGSVIPAGINISTGSFGYRMTIAAGANNATGDLTIGGVISGSGSVAYNSINVTVQKEGNGSVVFTGVSAITNGVVVKNGNLILSGGTNRLPVATQVVLGDGTANSARLILDVVVKCVNLECTRLPGSGKHWRWMPRSNSRTMCERGESASIG